MRCRAAAGVAAVVLGMAVTAVAPAAAQEPPAPSATLSLSPERSHVRWGTTVALRGTLRGPAAAGRRIQVLAQPYPYTAPEALLAEVVTDGDGIWRTSAKPDLNTRYRAVLADEPAVTSPVKELFMLLGGATATLVNGRMTVFGNHPAVVPMAGLRIHFYLWRPGRKSFVRKGSAALRALSPTRVRASFRFRPPPGRYRTYACYRTPAGFGPGTTIRGCGTATLPKARVDALRRG